MIANVGLAYPSRYEISDGIISSNCGALKINANCWYPPGRLRFLLWDASAAARPVWRRHAQRLPRQGAIPVSAPSQARRRRPPLRRAPSQAARIFEDYERSKLAQAALATGRRELLLSHSDLIH